MSRAPQEVDVPVLRAMRSSGVKGCEAAMPIVLPEMIDRHGGVNGVSPIGLHGDLPLLSLADSE